MTADRVFGLLLLIAMTLTSPARAQDALRPNCDPSKGAVDIDSCPNIRREGLRATYCMDGAFPCDKRLADYIRPRIRLVKGIPKFCKALLTENFEYVDFDLPHELTRQQLGDIDGRSLVELEPMAGKADFANDGHLEVLLPVIVKASSWRECDIPVFVELDADLKGFKRSALDKLLKPSDSCPKSFYPIRFEKRIYFETRRRYSVCFSSNSCAGFDLITEVHELNGSTRSRVCRFQFMRESS